MGLEEERVASEGLASEEQEVVGLEEQEMVVSASLQQNMGTMVLVMEDLFLVDPFFGGSGHGGPGYEVPGPGHGVPPPQAVPPWNATTLIMEPMLDIITPNHWMVLLFLQHDSCNVGR